MRDGPLEVLRTEWGDVWDEHLVAFEAAAMTYPGVICDAA
jgi:hypothetical protein